MKDLIKEAVRVYNKIAKIYTQHNYGKLMQYQLSKFASMLNGKNVLDAGCGPGRDVEYLMEDGFNVVGIDLSDKMIEEAKSRVPKGNFQIMDFRKMSFKDNSFDGIWSMVSMDHVSREEVAKVLKEFNRVLSSSGILYIATREGKGEMDIKREKYPEKRHVYLYEREEMEKYLDEANFKLVAVEVNTDEFGKKWLEVYARKN